MSGDDVTGLEGLVRDGPVWRVRDGAVHEAVDRFAHEEPLQLQLNGVDVAVVMRTPGHDEDLAVGFLVSEGIVERAADVLSVRHCSRVPDPEAEDNVVQIQLHSDVPLSLERLKRHSFASSSCGVCGKATLENALHTRGPVKAGATVRAAVLSSLPAALSALQPGFDATGGLHGALLFELSSGRVVVAREDVGRHNAVDKVLGYLVRSGLDANAHGVFVSGRLAYELVQKCAQARVPVLAGISAPTSLAARAGAVLGVCVVGFVRGGGLAIAACPERVVA
jgi:FdhD protein